MVFKFQLWRDLAAMARQDLAVALNDGLPVLVCPSARAHRYRGFPGVASLG